MTDTATLHVSPPATSDRWVLLEVMGHRSHVGRLREVAQFGVAMARIELVCSDCGIVGGHRHTHDYAGSAIFSITDLDDEADARKRAREHYGQKCEACRLRGLDEAKLLRAKSDHGCEGAGHCHGPMQWCDFCGDVSKVCDDPFCHQHALEEEGDEPAAPPAAFPRAARDEAERDATSADAITGQGECGAGKPGTCIECTRPEGHAGDHVAANGDDRIIARWPAPACDHSGIGLPGCKTCDPHARPDCKPQADAASSDDDHMMGIGTPPPAPRLTFAEKWEAHRVGCQRCNSIDGRRCEVGDTLYDDAYPF